MEITEDDLIALNVKRGHRRVSSFLILFGLSDKYLTLYKVIQRGIATLTGIPKTQPLTSISQSIVQSRKSSTLCYL